MLSEHTDNESICFGCKQPVGAGEMFSHFETCSVGRSLIPRHLACPRQGDKTFMIRVSTNNEFWLAAEVRGTAKLENLYMFLRGNWYVSCGYISPFIVEGKSLPEGYMQKTLNDIFIAGDTFRYSDNSDMPVHVSGEVTAVHYYPLEKKRCDICLAEMH
jgi:hypothetical protein